MNGVGHLSSLYTWQDVTSDFNDACGQLKLGQLLHDEMFGLFEAMSAIEMMDPKMDAGMLCNRATNTAVTWQDRVDSGHVCLSGLAGDLDPSHVSQIIDENIACLVTWLEGHSLAQTVMTNLYLHHVDKLTCAVIKPVSVVTLKLVEVIKDIIGKAGVFEEEDFQPHTFGFRLCSEVTEQRCAAGLREAEEIIAKDVRRTKLKEGVPRTQEEETEHADFLNLHIRVKFLRQFYMCLSAMLRGDVTEGSRLIGICQETWQSCSLTSVKKDGQVKGFEPLANQRLLPPTFPRYTEIVDRDGTVSYIEKLLVRLSSITAVTSISSFNSCLEFFHLFSAKSPCVLSRSLLQILYTPLSHSLSPRQGGMSPAAGPPIPPTFVDLLRDSCKGFMAPPCLLPAPKTLPGHQTSPLHSLQVKLCLDAFFSQCCRPFILVLQASGHNRARQRDKIAQVLEDFCAAQEEADRLDTMLNSLAASTGRPHVLYLGTWLLYHVLKLMVMYILSGWELDLYSSHEWAMMWWYLYELLYPWLINCLHRADTILSEHLENSDKDKKNNKNKKKPKTSNKKGVKSRPYLTEIAYYQAHANMCAGYYKLAVALKKEKKILSPNPQFDNEQVRYEHRLGAFACLLTPPLMPYNQYKEVLDHTEKVSTSTLFTAASRDFGQARQILESIQAPSTEDLSNLVTINKTNFVAASILARDVSRDIDFDFSLNQNFPVLKLV